MWQLFLHLREASLYALVVGHIQGHYRDPLGSRPIKLLAPLLRKTPGEDVNVGVFVESLH